MYLHQYYYLASKKKKSLQGYECLGSRSKCMHISSPFVVRTLKCGTTQMVQIATLLAEGQRLVLLNYTKVFTPYKGHGMFHNLMFCVVYM